MMPTERSADESVLSPIPESEDDQAENGEDTAEAIDEGELEAEIGEETLSPDKNDRSLAELHRWKRNGRLIVDPEWQREYVWDAKRASRLIESVMIDLPIPVIYLAVNKEGSYEVIDGLQRLTSIFRFFDGEYALKGLEIKRDCNGKKYSELPLLLRNKLEDTTFRTFELPAKTNKDLMFIIFERLNTGGLALNDMEIRNCLFRGKLNQLIKRLGRVPEFAQCVNQNQLEKRMVDRMLVLRFLAFYQMTFRKARRGLKRFLNEFFETYKNPSEEKLAEFERIFKNCMKASYTISGDKGFRLRRISGGTRGGEWGARMNAAIFQVIAVSFSEYDLGSLTRSADAIFEEYLDLISSDARWVDGISSRTGTFAQIEYAFETWNHRLKEVMSNSVLNDTVRLFSHELKEELFKQSSTCSLCGQNIKLLNDAVLDHELHYWRGGKTIPENARLAHRQCNLERSRNS
jgi:hypothetical protein